MVQDLSGLNLSGQSFQGKNLTGANFNGADIRGTNFTKSILKGANFSDTNSGLQLFNIVFIIAFSLLIIAVAGIVSGVGGILVVRLWNLEDNPKSVDYMCNIFIIISLLTFTIISIWKDFLYGSFIGILVLIPSVLLGLVLDGHNTSIITAFFFGIAVLSLIAISLITIALANNVMIVIISYLPIIIFGSLIIALISAMALGKPESVITTVVISVLGSYIGWQASQAGGKFSWIRKIAVFIAAIGGTSFRGADLTDADFTGATLKNTDFRTANLTRTRFYKAKKLDFARLGNTILSNRSVLNLLVSCNGSDKSYAGANLRGANLRDADLIKANLKDADISEATFQDAHLEGAILTLTQAIGTNFTNAHMTGACVESWNIDSTTNLDNVDCRFIYLLEHPKPGTDDRERRPSSGEFQPGEFSKLFKEVLNTVDLIFRDGIDWKAFMTAFKTVQVQNEDTELVIQSIENKGDGVVVVKVAVPDNADKEKIHIDFTQNYQLALQEAEKFKALLQAKNEQFEDINQKYSDLSNITKLLASQTINIQNNLTQENKNMTNSNDSSRNINVGRDFNATGTINLGEISGTVTNTINELPPSPEPEKPGIKEILTQLQTAIEADTDLSEEDKADALEQVKALAEAGKNPQEGAMQKAAKTAIKILKGTIAGLPSATKLVEECSKLLPLISGFLGLG